MRKKAKKKKREKKRKKLVELRINDTTYSFFA